MSTRNSRPHSWLGFGLALYLAAVTIPVSAEETCTNRQTVYFPEEYGLSYGCSTSNCYDWRAASQQLSPAGVCDRITSFGNYFVVLANLPADWGGVQVCAQPGTISNGIANPFQIYFPIVDTPFCRNPQTGEISPIDSLGAPYGSPGATIFFCHYLGCPPQQYLIRLSRPDGSSADSVNLEKIEPGSIGGPSTADTTILVAKVYDQNNQIVPDAAIQLTIDVVASSGGHQHDDAARHNNYAGTLSPIGSAGGTVSNNGKTLNGNTGTAGLFFRFASPAFPNNPAGDHTITASCTDGKNCIQQGPKQVWVGIRDLVEIPASISLAPWNLVGQKDSHPKNHYLTAEAMVKLIALAKYYSEMFPNDPVLQLNDASLERGGLFDLYPVKPAWNQPHSEHRRGFVIDIQANGTATAIPNKNFDGFRRLARLILNMDFEEEQLDQSNGHFHVRLLGMRYRQ